ncbi:peptidase M28 family protein [Parashewanella spongiae]|uniref:Carboxypeptidase Q n=1 Tax=Parashewanella spongiae TaxID=342950 RepID=A0A3A6TM59_9GAMM|nr:M28 family peptidase [Parashewanella spongiae]MCL1077953.1 M28 family peptidase [Parashewanella spongiae]RJY16922.1 peptidase M28 family protein [Parashewanella spongiae]
MKTLPSLSLAGIIITSLLGCQSSNLQYQDNKTSHQLQQSAVNSNLGYDIVESLTVEVGPRLAGGKNDLVAVKWAEDKFKSLGYDKVYKEPVKVPVWSRGDASAEVVSPFPQPLVITALGGSVATPENGLTAEIVRFHTLADLKKAEPAQVKGKIVFIDQKTERHKAGNGYGKSVGGRSKGAIAAAKKGAVAIVIRSIGTDHDRMAHTGAMRYKDGIKKIPAAALSAPDANQLNAILKRDKKVVISLKLSPQHLGYSTSYNVIGEIKGQNKPEEIVLIGAHLDSWDEGTGALDDGAGVSIVMAAGKHILDLPTRPARTVRVVLYAAEELGLIGGKQYVKTHKNELNNHYIAAESDFGAGYIYRIDVNVAPQKFEQVKNELSSMKINGVELGNNEAGGGPDVSMMPSLGVPVASLRQDGRDYFDYHHTPNDTIDKIDPKALAQNIAAYTQFAYLMAQSTTDLRPIKKK